MQEGWECKKCHNVYSPNTPFCLYCWFQLNQTAIPNNTIATEEPIVEPEIQEVISEPITTSPTAIDASEIRATSIGNISQSEIVSNKKLFVPQVDIEIPVLNKLPNVPPPTKYPDTQIFLSGIGHSKERAIARKFKIPYILDSIIDLPIQPSQLVRKYFDYVKKQGSIYMLDSGAFTYMMNPKKSLDLNEHLKQYCYYINEFDIKYFFELDLDIFMSIEEIENIRRKIYLETHKKPIIVYHDERGHDYWTNMCKEEEFVAVGGIASAKAYGSTAYVRYAQLCEEAHSYGTLVHGLGFTPLSILNAHKMFFDTVDSTTWNFTKRGCTAAISETGELLKLDGTSYFSASDGQENDLKVWAQFATDYRGAPYP